MHVAPIESEMSQRKKERETTKNDKKLKGNAERVNEREYDGTYADDKFRKWNSFKYLACVEHTYIVLISNELHLLCTLCVTHKPIFPDQVCNIKTQLETKIIFQICLPRIK